MKNTKKKSLKVTYRQVHSPDAEKRISDAYDILFSEVVKNHDAFLKGNNTKIRSENDFIYHKI